MDIIIKPIITEKMTALGETKNKFGFIVDKKANKVEIKKAVEKLYGITVESVNTIRYGGKNKSRYTKTGIVKGKNNSFKKAIVTLPHGETINFYSNI